MVEGIESYNNGYVSCCIGKFCTLSDIVAIRHAARVLNELNCAHERISALSVHYGCIITLLKIGSPVLLSKKRCFLKEANSYHQ